MPNALGRRSLSFLFVICIACSWNIRAITMTETAHINTLPGSDRNPLLLTTLVFGVLVSWYDSQDIDLEIFQDHTPECRDIDGEGDGYNLWKRLLDSMIQDPQAQEKELIAKLMEERQKAQEIHYDVVGEHGITEFELEIPTQVQTMSNITSCSDKPPAEYPPKSNEDDNEGEETEEQTGEESPSEVSEASASPPKPSSIPLITGGLQVHPREDSALLQPVLTQLQTLGEDSLQQIGKGAFSRVYRLQGPFENQVIKVPHPSFRKNDSDAIREGRRYYLQTQSRNEKDKLLTLEHKNIIRLRAFAEVTLPDVGSSYLLIMDFSGSTLSHYLTYKSRWDKIKNDCRFIAHEILEGLVYLHSQGLSMGDMKDGNVLILKTEHSVQVRLIDMGACMTSGERERLSMQVVGTIGWHPPEYISNKIMTQGCDVFAYGLVCLSLTGIGFSGNRVVGNIRDYRIKSPERVNELVIIAMDDRSFASCGLNDDELSTSGIPADDAVRAMSSKRRFLQFIAALATRPDPVNRPTVLFLLHYFRL